MESSVNYFDIDSFDVQWKNSTEKQMTRIVKKARYLEPSIGIIPILAGFFSNHARIKEDAIDNLEFLAKKIKILLSDKKDPRYKKGMKESALVSARIYSRISPETPFEEINFFLCLLLELGGKGPSFTFKALYKGIIYSNSMGKNIGSVSETGRLALVDQYLQARPSVRLKYGSAFKIILESIGSRAPVIEFYSSLFDRHQDADPFLHNIKTPLRNPRTIMETELISNNPGKKILGLKALSMLLNRIPSKILLTYLNPEEKADVKITIYNIVENSSMGIYSDLFDSILRLFPQSKEDEALHAFKAMVTTGKLPLYKLMEKVKTLYPSLLPVIMDEISYLSKISFFFIQDIALNKEQYTKGILEINLACIFGMIKKRPERVVEIFKKGAICSKDISEMEVSRLINKTKELLAKEKKDIVSDFLPAITTLSHGEKTGKNKNPVRELLKDPIEKKLEILKRNISSESIDFEGNKISFQNLSGKYFRTAVSMALQFSILILTMPISKTQFS